MKNKSQSKRRQKRQNGKFSKRRANISTNINYDCRNECRVIPIDRWSKWIIIKTRRSSYMFFNRQNLKHKDFKEI